MSTSIEYASFLVRLWRAPVLEGERARSWHGEVEHIQSGRRWTFDTLNEVLTFLRQQTENPDVLRPPPGE